MQSFDDVAPAVARYFPEVHSVQALPPEKYVPAGQLAVQEATPFGETFPPVHGRQSVGAVEVVSELYVPAGQSVHSPAPLSTAYVPTGQSVQLLDPTPAYVPGPQVTHDVAPLPEYVPFGQKYPNEAP